VFSPQQVSTAPASGVNPGGVGARGHSAGWLELWYQPKIGSQALDLRGAEALIRMRHPQFGVVEPAAFIPHMESPALSQFVITQAVADWRYFLAEQRPLDLSIDLPISFLEDPNSFDYLCRQLPDDPAFAGLILEVDGSDITRDLAAVRDFARQARLRKVAISVDRLGGESTALLQLRDFPFVEIKVEPELVAGCAYDRAKRTLCRHIVGAANQFGARTVAGELRTTPISLRRANWASTWFRASCLPGPWVFRHSCARSGPI
jgi:EAL domain-containing protein (putative c-di-GMP-specific phosphodiesterase class I)